ncbi:DUF4097 family beta strand repeat-containing protein [Halopiger djelfimassiliensis]|uniref:DUF4097 family beta strand repeat-containing protein n=1 Tax=Halopiger djelfimassiliensis TaxID=1293047 RepID=UPI0006778BBF|nr:DUF4097 family beta strand repeat-containing protein [Halopiger djelfimassiliensis]
MQGTPSRRRVLAAGTLGVLTTLSGCIAIGSDATTTVTETYDPDGLDSISLTTTNGALSVEGHRDEPIDVRGHKTAPTEGALESVTLTASRDDGRLELEADPENTPFLFSSDPKLDLEVTAPSTTRIARAETVSGPITVRNATGTLHAETTNGRIDLTNIEGAVVADSTNGTVHITEVDGTITAETTNGDVAVTLGDGDGDLHVETTNGAVDVRAPPSLDATVSVTTTNGDVSIEGFDDSGVTTDGSTDLTLGEGTRRVRISTTNGDVEVRGDGSP